MANAPVFGRSCEINSIRTAVVNLGLDRMRQVLLSSCLMQITPRNCTFDPFRFWEHSFACAMVTQRLARKLRFADIDKAYLAGLIHDAGTLVGWLLVPEAFSQAVDVSATELIDLKAAELRILGITHCEIGAEFARHWGLPDDLVQVIAFHHEPQNARESSALAALVSLAEILCSLRGIGYEFVNPSYADFMEDPSWNILQLHFGALNRFDYARLTCDLGDYAEDIGRIVGAVFRY
jgi:putative nucleotidyltransferase with HDIG domain